jgi:tetratricopeptide (TPR) repeat protein
MSEERVIAMYQEGQWEQVVKLTKNWSTQDGSQLNGIRLRSLALQKLGRWEEAMDGWNGLILRLGDVADFYSERGVCKFNLGFKSALDDFNKAIELDPNNGYRYASRAYVYDKIGRIKEAIADYEKAIELDPEDAISLNNLGITEQKRGKTMKASDLFAEADALLKEDMRILPQDDEEEIRFEPNLTAPQQQAEEMPPKSNVWKELRRMLSSKDEFIKFWEEAKNLFKKPKS